MSNNYYEVAQICLNGHMITARYNSSPEQSAKYCDSCGEKNIISCENCHTHIRGSYVVPGVLGAFGYAIPSYCHECGKSYPWTQQKLEAAKELAEELSELSEEEKESLKKSLDDLVKDGPKTVVATTRFKRLVSKTGPEIATGFKDILVDVVSESVKKAVWGS